MNKSVELRNFFEKTNRVHEYPKGAVIIPKNSDLSYSYFIEEGMVKIYGVDPLGNRRTVAMLAPGYVFPISWPLQELAHIDARYFYEAFTPVRCLVADRTELQKYLHNHPMVTLQQLGLMTGAYINALAHITHLQKSNVGERIEFILYYMAKVFGEPHKSGVIKIKADLTHQEIADLAGLSRETISLELRKPKFQNIYRKEAGTSYINLDFIDTPDLPNIHPQRPIMLADL